ncbi:thiamine phosphate synthase [Rapidithrix thailandica]|uniref:Thiamine-phosphate synthase n=1 Tax=Rapidithrix thailandica TaxID=413964 RepID=A0AAW9S4C2_9BACT
MISKLQYISQETPQLSHLQAIEQACQAGCDWIQLRMKDCSFEQYRVVAREAQKICEGYHAQLIINDNVEVAQDVKAYGVHLGKEDMRPSEARKRLGERIIIGGTANTFDDIQRLHGEGVDYIGLGPLRFTTTKKKLSPVLGLKGYRNILDQMHKASIVLPVVAIGGVRLVDVPELRQCGVFGIAVSGLITHAENKKAVVDSLFDKLSEEA